MEAEQHRIVVIDEEFPFPLDSGKRIRSFNRLSRLAKRCQLHYLAFGREDSEAFVAFKKAGMLPIAVDEVRPRLGGPLFYVRLLGNLFSQDPFIVARHRSGRFKERLSEAIAEVRPEVILCEWTPYANYFEDLGEVCKITVAHNMEQTIWRRYQEHAGPGPKKWYIGEQARKVARFEERAFRRSDAAIAVSDREAAEIARINPALTIGVVENGVDLMFFGPAADVENPVSARPSMVFVGAMNWWPNQDAMRYFVESILPRVQRMHPEATLSIVGQDPPDSIRRLEEGRGVKVLGKVEAVRPHVHEATVYVVPLRIGGGTRLKILEALAMKKAVVSTSVGAEGLDGSNSESTLQRRHSALRHMSPVEHEVGSAELVA